MNRELQKHSSSAQGTEKETPLGDNSQIRFFFSIPHPLLGEATEAASTLQVPWSPIEVQNQSPLIFLKSVFPAYSYGN